MKLEVYPGSPFLSGNFHRTISDFDLRTQRLNMETERVVNHITVAICQLFYLIFRIFKPAIQNDYVIIRKSLT